MECIANIININLFILKMYKLTITMAYLTFEPTFTVSQPLTLGNQQKISVLKKNLCRLYILDFKIFIKYCLQYIHRWSLYNSIEKLYFKVR